MYDYDSKMTKSDNTGRSMMPTTISGFVVGAVLGAGLALLLAPASGIETRRRLGETARRVRDNARQRFDKGREVIDGVRQDASAALDAGKEAVRRRHDSGNRVNQPGLESSVPGEFR